MAEEGSRKLFNGRLRHILVVLAGLCCVTMLILQSLTLYQVTSSDDVERFSTVVDCKDPTDEYLRSKFGSMFMYHHEVQSVYSQTPRQQLNGACCTIITKWTNPPTAELYDGDTVILAAGANMSQYFYTETCESLNVTDCRCQNDEVYSSAVYVDDGVCKVGLFKITNICHSINVASTF